MLWFHCSDEGGQILAATALFMAVLLFLVTIVGDIGEGIILRIKLQNACDAGALAGATVLNLGLELLDILNALILLALILNWEFVPTLSIAQDYVVTLIPGISITLSVIVAYLNGADFAMTCNDSGLPSLMVKRKRRLFFGESFLIYDDFKATKSNPNGERYIRLVAAARKRESKVGSKFLEKLSIPSMIVVSEAAPLSKKGSYLDIVPSKLRARKVCLMPISRDLDFVDNLFEELL
jgi:hypothetical protein